MVRRWPTCEVNGLILVWFHCDGKEPEWPVPEHEEIAEGKWVYRGRTEHFINAHVQVGADVCKQTHRRHLSVFSMGDLWDAQRALFRRKSLKTQPTWLTWLTCTRRA